MMWPTAIPGTHFLGVIERPAELVDHGGDVRRAVGGSARDDEIRSLGEGFHLTLRANIGVGLDDVVEYAVDVLLAGVQVRELQPCVAELLESIEDVISVH